MSKAAFLAALTAGQALLLPITAMAQVPPRQTPPQTPPPAAPAQSPPPPSPAPSAATAPAAPTTAALTAADPAVVLRAPNIQQPERDEAARRVLMRRTPEAGKQILAALRDGTNRDGQLAAARAIVLDPDPDQAFINPLFDLIGQPRLTDTAIQALANYRGQSDVANNLRRLAGDTRQQPPTRIGAIRAVGTMTNKSTARMLMDLLNAEGESPAIRAAAATALSDLTGSSVVRTDPAYWQRWWAANEPKDDAAFEHDLLDARTARLVRLQNRFDRFAAEQRTILEELYQRAPEKDKEPTLLRYLRSTEPETRSLGARLVADDFKQTRPVTPTVRDQLRAMVADSSSQVRVAVAQTLLLLNDAQALGALLAQLEREPDPDVRMELARALVPMRDVRVVDPLIRLLRDPSPAVVEVAARGLGSDDLVPLIKDPKNPNLATRVAVELRRALSERAGQPGSASLRATIVDSMGALQNTNLRDVFIPLLSPREPVPVRRAALRALGQFGKPGGETWPAAEIAESLRDPDDSVRQEAVRAMKTTADFAHAEVLYELSQRDSSRAVRDEAWGVLRNLFSDETAGIQQLFTFADRFRNDPERRIEVFKVLARRLTPLTDEKSQDALAAVRQNLGAEYMELAKRALTRNDLDPAARQQTAMDNAAQADIFFDLALKHFRTKDPNDTGMATSNLIELRMDALLTRKQYKGAVDFAADCIAANSQSLEAVARKVSAETDRLHRQGKLDDALQLIDAWKKINPPLADPTSAIERIEAEIRGQQNQNPASDNLTTPRSAVGTGGK